MSDVPQIDMFAVPHQS